MHQHFDHCTGLVAVNNSQVYIRCSSLLCCSPNLVLRSHLLPQVMSGLLELHLLWPSACTDDNCCPTRYSSQAYMSCVHCKRAGSKKLFKMMLGADSEFVNKFFQARKYWDINIGQWVAQGKLPLSL